MLAESKKGLADLCSSGQKVRAVGHERKKEEEEEEEIGSPIR